MTAVAKLKPETPELPAVDFGKEVELCGIAFPMLAQNGATSIVIGRHWAAGFWASGIVRRIALMRDGTIRVLLEQGDHSNVRSESYHYVFITQAGLYMEMAGECYAPPVVTDEERAAWPKSRTGS